MRARSFAPAVLTLATAAIVVAPVRGQTRPPLVDLGGGVSVVRPAPFYAWAPSGFTFGDHADLAFAVVFARAQSGRIVAVAPRSGSRSLGESGCVLLFTDDLGVHWRSGDWPSSSSSWPGLECQLLSYPTRRHAGRLAASVSRARGRVLLALDPGSARGVAVTATGEVLSTEDEGAHWRVRRWDTRGMISAWVRGRTVVFLDGGGQVWRSPDGGFALETFAPGGTRVEERDGELFLVEGGRDRRRIDGRGAVHRL